VDWGLNTGQFYSIRDFLSGLSGNAASLSVNHFLMKFLCSVLLLISLPFIAISQQTITGSILHNGLTREYILFVPSAYASGTPAPLVFNFHGYGSNALQQMFYGDFRPIADTAGFLVVHPQGSLDQLGNPHWNVDWGLSTVDDVGFTSALIDSLSATYDIDPERIYSTGMSNGGFLSYKLACELSDRIAAIASVTGSMNVNQTLFCDPQHPMPVMEIHGTADETVPYGGSIVFASIPSVVEYWVEFNSCDSIGIIQQIEDTDPADGSTAEHQLFTNGTNGVDVEHYRIINGGHTWPGSAFDIGVTNHDIDASQEIWRFFSRYDIYGLIENVSAVDHIHQSTILVYPNPASTGITIESALSRPMPFVLSNMQGQQLSTGLITEGHQSIPFLDLPQGLYVLTVGDQVFRIVINE
jgi:polyhydroxybutyrate depolymerase